MTIQTGTITIPTTRWSLERIHTFIITRNCITVMRMCRILITSMCTDAVHFLFRLTSLNLESLKADAGKWQQPQLSIRFPDTDYVEDDPFLCLDQLDIRLTPDQHDIFSIGRNIRAALCRNRALDACDQRLDHALVFARCAFLGQATVVILGASLVIQDVWHQ